VLEAETTDAVCAADEAVGMELALKSAVSADDIIDADREAPFEAQAREMVASEIWGLERPAGYAEMVRAFDVCTAFPTVHGGNPLVQLFVGSRIPWR
jgi:hypothetical protein